MHFVYSYNVVVTFELNENDYSGAEDDGFIVTTINKNVRLANPVTLLLTPYSISVAIESRQPLPDDIPTEDNLLQNYARCEYIVCTRDVSGLLRWPCALLLVHLSYLIVRLP